MTLDDDEGRRGHGARSGAGDSEDEAGDEANYAESDDDNDLSLATGFEQEAGGSTWTMAMTSNTGTRKKMTIRMVKRLDGALIPRTALQRPLQSEWNRHAISLR